MKSELAREARALGFDALGVTSPDPIPGALPRLQAFLDDGAHGDMAWLANDPPRRASPSVLWSDVRSIIVLGMNYGPDEDPLRLLEEKAAARSRSMRAATITTI